MVPGRWLCLAALAALATGLAGCGGGSGGGSAGGSAEPAGQVLHVAQQAEPTTLDPAQVQDGPTIELMMQIYDGLVQWNVKNELVPALAEKWDISEGGRTYTFHLRDGVKFHNGRALTAEDVVYSITRSLSPKVASPIAEVYLGDIVGAKAFRKGTSSTLEGVSAPDPKTVKIRIDVPKAYFLAKLTYPTAYAVCKEAIEKTGGKVDETSMIGTGPFKLTEYRRGDRLILDANPDYFEGAPKLARVERRVLLDNGSRRDKFEAGELDIADISMATYHADKDNAELQSQLHQFPRPSVYYMALNQKAFPAFKNPKVRQAFAMAVDRQQIVDSVHEGVPQPAHGIVPAGVPGHDPSFRGFPYDPDRARKLLAEAGYPGGQGFPPLTLSFRASVEDIKNTATAVQDDLQKNLGIRVNLDEVEWGTFLDRRTKGTMPFYFLRWAADYLDPQNFLSTMLRTGSPENTLGYSNPEFDRLCDAADVMQDHKKRMATYHKAEAIAVNDAPWIPIYFQKDVELWNPKLRGVEDSLMGHLPHKRTYFEGGN
jgi:ABC-type transport system substrate-binding protein